MKLRLYVRRTPKTRFADDIEKVLLQHWGRGLYAEEAASALAELLYFLEREGIKVRFSDDNEDNDAERALVVEHYDNKHDVWLVMKDAHNEWQDFPA